MKTLKDRVSDVSMYLQSLMAPRVFTEVQEAVEKEDRDLLMKACRKAEVPEIYLATVVSLLLSVSPQQKWPPIF
jgi:hypothetical protein